MTNLTKEELAKRIDHTHLKPDATPEQIVQLCKEAKQYGFHSVCVNSIYVPLAKQQLKGSPVKVCSVVGFPLGTMSTKSKVAEASQAIKDGATEIDMVSWIGGLKAELDGEVKEDIRKVVEVCHTHGALCKVIIETCLLTAEEKERACNLVCGAGADFVKTSTGFSKGGATVEDVVLMRKTVGNRARIKAAGGIRTYQQAIDMIKAGADRLGTSASVKIVAESQSSFTL